MNAPSPEHALVLAAILFALGLAGVLARRNLVFMLMSVEILLNAAGLAWIAAGQSWQQADGQVMFLFVITLAGAEVAVGLGLLLLLSRRQGTLDADALRRLAG